jgi:hypothetical protein
MRSGSRMITEKSSRKGSEKNRRGIINEGAGPRQAISEAVGDCDGRTKMYGAGLGGIYEHLVSPVCEGVSTSRGKVGRLGGELQRELCEPLSRMKGALSPKKEIVGGDWPVATSGVSTGSLAADDDGPESLQQATQMPGFDPVRDAVLNSPITRSPTLPRHRPPPSTSAATSPHNAPAPPAQAPRRATVAALLNDTSPSPTSSSFHPPHLPVRTSSLAHILHPNPPDDPPRFPSPEDKLSRVSSLGRLPSEASPSDPFRASSLPSSAIHPAARPLSSPQPEIFTPTTERASGLFTPTAEQRGPVFSATVPIPTSPTSARLSLSRPSTSSSTSYRPPPSPIMHRPPVPRARSPTPQRPPSPPPKPQPLPYKPRRKTPAGSVLEPLTPDEMRFYRTQLGTGTRRLAKRKRSPSYEPPDDQPLAKKSRDAGLVMDHCTLPPCLFRMNALILQVG